MESTLREYISPRKQSRPVATDVARSMVCASVRLFVCVLGTLLSCVKRLNRDAVWWADTGRGTVPGDVYLPL